MTTIGQLIVGQTKPIYRRRNGKLYKKVNKKFHAPVKYVEEMPGSGRWTFDGKAEAFVPEEEVVLIHPTCSEAFRELGPFRFCIWFVRTFSAKP